MSTHLLVPCFALGLLCGACSSSIATGAGDLPLVEDSADLEAQTMAPDLAAAERDAAAPRDALYATDGQALVDAGGPRDAGAAGVVDPRSWKPKAKGLWIWYFDYLGMTAQQAAVEAATVGVGYVLIKSGQDANYWNTRYNAASVAEFTSRGIPVFAWPYVTPANVPGSIAAIASAAAVPGTSGVVLDVEVEFEGNFAAQAKALCDGIRAKVPGVWLAYTSFGWVGYHGAFPFSTFDAHCGDAFFPQVYWSDRGVTWTKGYDQALQMITDAKLTAPVWMIESNDDIYQGGAPSTADLNSFFDKAGARASLWEFPAKGVPAKLAQLPSLRWMN